MTFLTDLHEVICVVIVSEWCNLYDLRLLDIALKATKKNTTFLSNLFQSDNCSVPCNNPQNSYDNECVQWACDNGLSVRKLIITKSLVEFNKDIFLDLNLSKTYFCTFYNPKPIVLRKKDIASLVKQLNIACDLKIITLTTLDKNWDLILSSIHPSILQNVKKVKFDYSTVKGPIACIQHLALHCRSLTTLSLKMKEDNTTHDNDINELIKNNKNLEFIAFKDAFIADNTISTIVEHCLAIDTVEVEDCQDITLPIVTKLFAKCHSVDKIFISNRHNMDHYIFDSHDGDQVEIDFFMDKIRGLSDVKSFFTHVKDINILRMNFLSSLPNELVDLIIDNNPKLEHVGITESYLIHTDYALSQLLTRCGENLTTLELAGCNLITNEQYVALFNPPSSNNSGSNISNALTSLTFRKHMWITSDTLYEILNGCPELETLICYDNYLIDDADVYHYLHTPELCGEDRDIQFYNEHPEEETCD